MSVPFSRSILALLALLLLPSAPGVSGVAAGADPTPAVEFLGDGSLQLIRGADGMAESVVFIRNTGDAPLDGVRLYAVLKDEKGTTHTGDVPLRPEDRKINPLEVKAIPFKLALGDATQVLTGYLALTGPGKVNPQSPPALRLTLNPARADIPFHFAGYPVWLGLVAALLLISICAIRLLREGKFGQKMGVPTWSLGESMATNLAVLGASLSGIISSLLPEQTRHLRKVEYQCLVMLLGLLLVLAPMIYNFINTSARSLAQLADGGQSEGTVQSFLFSNLITLWAVFGQVVTLLFLLDELRVGRIMTVGAIGAFQVALVLAMLFLSIYAVRKILSSAEGQEREAGQQTPRHDEDAMLSGHVSETAFKASSDATRAKRWPVL